MLLLGVYFSSSIAGADQFSNEQGHDWVPIPWSVTQEFPWTGVPGTWRSFESNLDWLFSLRVVRQKNKMGNLLEIKIINPKNCKVIAKGSGWERNRVVRGQLTSDEYGVLRISLGSFKPGTVDRQPTGLYRDGVFAVSITKLKEAQPMAQIQITKEYEQEVDSILCSL